MVCCALVLAEPVRAENADLPLSGSVWVGPSHVELAWESAGGEVRGDWSGLLVVLGADGSITWPLDHDMGAGVRAGVWLGSGEVSDEAGGGRFRASTPVGTEVRGLAYWQPDPDVRLELSAGLGTTAIAMDTRTADGREVESEVLVLGTVLGVAAQWQSPSAWQLRAEVAHGRPSGLKWDDGQRMTLSWTQLRVGAVFLF